MKNDRRMNNRISGNKGFTLVELIVVLVIMVILLSITIFGGLAWQDWARFRKVNTTAEDIFFAAQNQLTEYDASGVLEKKIKGSLASSSNPDEYSNEYVMAYSKNGSAYGILGSIKDDDGVLYQWSEVWNDLNGTNKNTATEDRHILSLKADKGDYSKYLKIKGGESGVTLNEGTILLFDMVAPYVSDTAILDGSFILEFSPEAAQVFSVLYNDRADELYYNTQSGSGDGISVMDRSEKTRKEVHLGYYSVKKLTEKLHGKSVIGCKLKFFIENSNTLDFVIDYTEESFNPDDIITFTVFDGDDGNGDDEVMTFNIKFSDLRSSFSEATSSPVFADFEIKKGDYAGETLRFRLPAWKDEANKKIYIIMDAADAQAQTVVYNAAKSDTNEAEKMRNTYSFYRFGLAKEVNYIYGSLFVTRDDGTVTENVYSARKEGNTVKYHNEEKTTENSYGECTTFAAFTGSGSTATFDITNARHLYNMRYETEYKTSSSKKNKFELKADIDWNDFINSSGQANKRNNYLNSYDNNPNPSERVEAGINFKGDNAVFNGASGAVNTDTAYFPFPGFRCLGKGDTFTQAHPYGESGSYVIKNLKISFAGNILYGVYDDVLENTELSGSAKIKSDSHNGNFSDITGVDKTNGYKPSLSRGGALPLGLFAENLGTISNITLDDHIVCGIETSLPKSTNEYLSSNMVGGFVGNNIGEVSSLTLLDSDSKTHISGRTDVGGIIGRESFVLEGASRNVTLNNLANYGTVTGKENVGGIVGRVYTHYVGDKNKEHNYTSFTYYGPNGTISSSDEKDHPRYSYYHDGYFITDNYKSMTGENVDRAGEIVISDCHNRGKVSGDSCYDENNSRSAFIGGIAGITMDGFIYDNRSVYLGNGPKTYDNALLTYYANVEDYFNGGLAYVTVKNCDSFVDYDTNSIRTGTFRELTYDYFVGGLIGYARLTTIENCNNAPDGYNGVSSSYVLGRGYVGGIAGCSDMSIYSNSGATENTTYKRTYAATNYNNVIGQMFVGGIAGGFGIGDNNQNTISFKEPSLNTGTYPSQAEGDNRYLAAKNLLNTAVVLGLHSNSPYNSHEFDYNNGSWAIGGISGASRQCIADCDNIQPQQTKELAATLVSGTTNTSPDTASANNWTSSSKFGGNYVGGICGYIFARGMVNADSNHYSQVDAFVFGQDYVGGGVGGCKKENKESYTYNILPINPNGSTGLVVIGRDGVGGIYGFLQEQLYSTQKITGSYKVIGRYGVGGIVGVCNEGEFNISTTADRFIEGNVNVNALCYAGGIAGVVNYPAANDKVKVNDIKSINVNANYFAGGAYGAYINKDNGRTTLKEISDNKAVISESIHVSSDAFSGGITGIYMVPGNGYKQFGDTNGSLMNLANTLLTKDLTGAVATAILDNKLKPNGGNTITFSNSCNVSANVEAKVFAGGFCGFSPDIIGDNAGATITVNGFKNGCNITTTGRVSGIVENFEQDKYYAYLGGLTGRIPCGMVVTNCSNPVLQTDGKIYKQNEAAEYMGGLCEVNAGTITGCNNFTNFTSVYSNIAPFAGVNGTTLYSGVITNCTNRANITANSASASGIAVMSGYNSVIDNCVNTGTIDAASSASGIAVFTVPADTNNNQNPADIKNCVNLGTIKGSSSASGIASLANGALIRYCSNYGNIDGRNENAITVLDTNTLTGNLVDNGFNEENGTNPIAPNCNAARNFYVFGTGDVSSNVATLKVSDYISHGKFAGVDPTYGMTEDDDWKDYYEQNVESKLLSFITAYLGNTTYSSDEAYIRLINQKNNLSDAEFNELIRKALNNYLEFEDNINDWANEFSYSNHETQQNNLMSAFISFLGTADAIQSSGASATPHWPLQLYVQTNTDGTFTLLYLNETGYHSTGIVLDAEHNPSKSAIDNYIANDYEKVIEINNAIMSMIKDDTTYPDNVFVP